MEAVRHRSPGGLCTLVKSCSHFRPYRTRLRPVPDKAAWGGCPQSAAGTGLRQQPPAPRQGAAAGEHPEAGSQPSTDEDIRKPRALHAA